MPFLSIIVPVFNESRTIADIISKIDAIPLEKELIIVDDGSTDETGAILRTQRVPNLKLIHHTSNRGKGAAILTGLANAGGDLVIIQDADLEYDPADYMKLIGEIQKGGSDLVLGNRFYSGWKGEFIQRCGNKTLTGMLNALFGTKIRDCFTCYKLANRGVIQKLGLKARGFDIEIEFLARAIRSGLKIKEIPVSYTPRKYSEGKKISFWDGIGVLCSIVRYRIW
ncbi:MAG: glycosyltransferase family 2 protein [Candidatus Omnitrophota bacterium]|jgi:glycosyltransferase involved in cell wall biosynthesis